MQLNQSAFYGLKNVPVILSEEKSGKASWRTTIYFVGQISFQALEQYKKEKANLWLLENSHWDMINR